MEFGAGAAVARLRGSAHNDAFYYDEAGRVRTRTNRHGGVLGGMTTDMPLLLTCHIKPTPSIALPQERVNLQTHESARLCVDVYKRQTDTILTGYEVQLYHLIIGEPQSLFFAFGDRYYSAK